MQASETSRHFISPHYLQHLSSAAVLDFFWIVFYLSICMSKQCQTAQKDSVSRPETALPSSQTTWFLDSRTWSHLFSYTSNSCLVHCHNSMTFISVSPGHVYVFEFCVSATTLEFYPELWYPQESTLPGQVTDIMWLSVTVPRHREYF